MSLLGPVSDSLSAVSGACVCAEDGRGPPEDDWMIECDVCHVWFHGDCVSVPKVCIATIDKFHCPKCQPLCGASILKPVTNSHRLDPCQTDAAAHPVQVGTRDFVLALLERRFAGGVLRRPDARGLSKDALLAAPVVVDTPNGLGLTVPDPLRVKEGSDVSSMLQPLVESLGDQHQVDVIDSYKQGSFPLPLEELCQTFASDEEDASLSRPLNCLGLEISDSSLGQALDSPSLVRQMCWVSRDWHEDANWSEVPKPKVQKYCILSMTHSYTDFHVDFGGSSVWYHVLRGRKTFYLLEPTSINLSVYERWQKLSNHSEVFLPELLSSPETSCQEVTLTERQTLFIPSGWIHAVVTNERAVVLGGNFVHELNMSLQWKINELESRLNVPTKFRYPHFEELHWIVAWKWNRRLKEKTSSSASDPVLPPFLTRAKAMLKTLKLWLSQDTSTDNGVRRKQSAFIKDFSKSLKKWDKSLKSGGGSVVYSTTSSPTDSGDRVPALPKLKLTLSTKTNLDLTDRNNVRHLMQNPVPRSLETELSNALQDFDDQSDEEHQEQRKRKMIEKKEEEVEEEGALLINTSNKRVSSRQHLKRRRKEELPGEAIRQVYQDDDFVYPALDLSDDEEMEEMKKQERKKDGNWKPKAKIQAVSRKTDRPSREGAAKIEVKRGLQEMAAKKVSKKKKKKKAAVLREEEPPPSSPEPPFIPSSPLIPATPKPSNSHPKMMSSSLLLSGGDGSSLRTPLLMSSSKSKPKVKRLLPEKSASSSSTPSDGKPKKTKGMATAKQRLGKLLKLKF